MLKNLTRHFRTLFFTSLGLAFLLGVLVFKLLETPFGPLFWSIAYLFIFCILFFFSLIAIKYIYSKRIWKKALAYILATLCGASFLLMTLSIFDINIWDNDIENLSEQEWHADFEYLVNQIGANHPAHLTEESNRAFKSAVQSVRDNLNQLSPHRKIVEFNKLIALLNDGHSSIWPGFAPINSHSFPVQFYFFDDGLHVIDVGRGFKEIIGSKVLKIGNKTVDQLYEQLKVVTGSENEAGKKVRFTMYATIAEILKAEGVIDSVGKLPLLIEMGNGKQELIELEPISTQLWMFWSMVNFKPNKSSHAFKNIRNDFYWFEYWEESKTIYFQFNIVFNDIFFGESIEEFSKRLNEFATNTDFDRFIIDIRNNNGGNNQLLAPLIKVLSENTKINRSGELFTIIGRHTFSAAANFAQALENKTKTIFVGESMGTSPNFYGDTPDNFLPNSNIQLILSSWYWVNSIAEDRRKSIEPEIGTRYTHQDFLNKTDPSIDAILSYTPIEKREAVLPERKFDTLEGIYRFSDTKLLWIKNKNNRLSFTIDDFVPLNFSNVSSELYPISETKFNTDIHNVYLNVHKDSLYFDWMGMTKIVKPLSKSTLNPIDYIKAGRMESIKRGIWTPDYTEDFIHSWGDHFMEANKFEIALKIFKSNTLEYPKSSNAFYGLAKIYLMMGDKKQAVLNFKKSVELNPENTDAIEALERVLD